MYFTQEDYRKIEKWLYQRIVKDTQFPNADPLDGTERVPLVQDGANRTVSLNELVERVAAMKLPDFINVTMLTRKPYLALEDAVAEVPVSQRKLGLVITFHNENGNWLIYQFAGSSVTQWTSLNYWRNIVMEALEELMLFPDEEDVTGIRDGNRTFLKFKNRDYDPDDFIGMGMVILRRNLKGTESCAIDDEDHLINVLTQDMISKPDTVYVIEYDFDLEGKVISVPDRCVLWFQGGKLNNGTLHLKETAILGAFEFADMGDVKLFGTFNKGQVMTFFNDSYKAKTGKFFKEGTRPSSATGEEDAEEDEEKYFDTNPDAYTVTARQELRWWNGAEWLLLLDTVDYQELKSVIEDLIEKHNAEMSACYQYFKERLYALELRVDKTEQDITDIQQTIEELTQNLQELFEHVNSLGSGVKKIKFDDSVEYNVTTEYAPDDSGLVKLPSYSKMAGANTSGSGVTWDEIKKLFSEHGFDLDEGKIAASNGFFKRDKLNQEKK